jgi:hypothetical protein
MYHVYVCDAWNQTRLTSVKTMLEVFSFMVMIKRQILNTGNHVYVAGNSQTGYMVRIQNKTEYVTGFFVTWSYESTRIE